MAAHAYDRRNGGFACRSMAVLDRLSPPLCAPASLDWPALSLWCNGGLYRRGPHGYRDNLRMGLGYCTNGVGPRLGYNGIYGLLRDPAETDPDSQGVDGTRLRGHV